MRFVFAGIFILAGSILLLEIALTRVLAVMMWHHMTYMVVSVALLGFGASGSILTARGEGLATGSPARALTWFTLAYGVSVVVAFCVATRIPIDTLQIWSAKWNFVALALFYAVISTPFLFGGFAIGLALTRLSKHIGRLYFFDLMGSAVGGGLSVWLLSTLGSSATVMVAATLGLLAATVFAAGSGRRLLMVAVPALMAGVALSVAFATGLVEWDVPFAPGKEFAGLPPSMKAVRIASPTAEVEVAPSGRAPLIMGGNFGIVDRRAPTGRFLGQDGTAPTFLYKDAASIETFPYLDDAQAGSAYVAFEARGGSDPDVLVIGVGGGIDVMIALGNNAGHVTAVEVNRAMVEVLTERFADYLGGLFLPDAHPLSDRIELVHGEGRSFVRSRDHRYDIIQLSGVDSYTALSTGAYTVSESYLYTIEAIQDFYESLNDDGYVCFSRILLGHPKKPRETLRLANTAISALAQLGIDDPERRVAVFQGHDWASTMIKRGEFTPAEIAALRDFASREGFWGLAFDPLEGDAPPLHSNVPYDHTARREIRKNVSQGAVADLPAVLGGGEPAAIMIRAYEHRLRDEDGVAAMLIDELRTQVAESRRGEFDAKVRELVDEPAAAGRDAERYFEQTRDDFEALLRTPGPDRSAFIAGYPYILTPATDDAPFFFNYYRYGGLFKRATSADNLYWPDYPVGHLVLIASLVQISLLAAALILLPLRALARDRIAAPNAWRVFGYFAALGAGFMFVEISLMQKMVLFLGHPTYALSVVLTTLLASAGTGALLAGRIATVSSRVLMSVLAGVVGAVLMTTFACATVLPMVIGADFNVRVALAVGLIAPLGLVLGMPFPLGIRVLDGECPQLVPWAWAINGLLSVFTSIFCIVLAMQIGFTNVLLVATATYAAGFLLMTSRAPAA